MQAHVCMCAMCMLSLLLSQFRSMQSTADPQCEHHEVAAVWLDGVGTGAGAVICWISASQLGTLKPLREMQQCLHCPSGSRGPCSYPSPTPTWDRHCRRTGRPGGWGSCIQWGPTFLHSSYSFQAVRTRISLSHFRKKNFSGPDWFRLCLKQKQTYSLKSYCSVDLTVKDCVLSSSPLWEFMCLSHLAQNTHGIYTMKNLQGIQHFKIF